MIGCSGPQPAKNTSAGCLQGKLVVFLKALRAPFLTGSLGAVAVGVGSGFWFTRTWDPLLALLTALGVVALHSGANLINDYYDSAGSDPLNVHVTPFSGGSRVIQDQDLCPAAVKKLALLCFAVGAACGLGLIALGRPWVALVGLLGLLAGYAYSARPLQLMSLGLGEATIFFAFGPLLTWGAFYVQTDSLQPVGLAVGLPLGFLITAIIWINEFPDMAADTAAGKRTLVVRLGWERSRWGFLALMAAPFLSLIWLAEFWGLPDLIFAAFAALPPAILAVRTAFTAAPTTPEFIPAQAYTIHTHLWTGVMQTLGLIYGGLFR